MQSFNKKILLAGCLASLLGAVLYFAAKPSILEPPAIVERPRATQTVAQDPSPALELLTAPWFRVPIVGVAPPAPKAPPPTARVDTTSITLLGSSKDRDGSISFFFKYAPLGQVIILKEGETKKAWTLKAVGARAFTLLGPGGQYEVAR